MRPSGRTKVTIAHRTLDAAGDPLLVTVREASEGLFEVYGEIGRGRESMVVYLAKELASGRLVALTLQPDPADPSEYTLDVARQLDKTLPAPSSVCLQCRAPLEGWGQFCPSCGADVTGSGEIPADSAERREMLEAVRAATEGEYEILGEMDRAEGRGVVYFARDLESGEITALRLKKEKAGTAEEEYSLGQTRVLKPLVQSLGGGPERRSAPRATPPAPAHTPSAPPPPARRRPAAKSPRSVRPPWLTPARLRVAGIALGIVALVTLFAVVWSGRAPTPPVPAPADTLVSGGQAAVGDSTGFLLVGTTLPEGATLSIGGEARDGRLLELPLGTHIASISAAGYQPFVDTITLSDGGRTIEWAPRLVPVARPRQADRPRPTPPPQRPAPRPVDPPASCATAYLAKKWDFVVTLCNADAARGDAFAQRILGGVFEAGLSGPVDLKQAADWYKKAADQGDAEAMYRLGLMTLDGRGVKRSEKDGMNWLRKAAANGSAQAASEIKRRQ